MDIHKLNVDKHKKLLLYIFRELGADKKAVPITHDKLAEFARTNRVTINKHLRELQEIGLLSIVAGLGSASSTYRLTLE